MKFVVKLIVLLDLLIVKIIQWIGPIISNKPNVSQETQAQVIFWPQFVPLKPTRLQLIKPNIQGPPKPSEQRVMPHSLPKKEEFSGQTHNPQYLFKNFDPRCNKHV